MANCKYDGTKIPSGVSTQGGYKTHGAFPVPCGTDSSAAAPAPQAEGTCPELSHALETLKSVRTRLVEKVGNLQKELESLTDVIDSIEGKP